MNLEDHLKTGTLVELSVLKEHNKFMKFNTLIDKPFHHDVMTVATPMLNGRLHPIPVNAVVNINFLITNEDGSKEPMTFKAKVIARQTTDNSTLTLQKVNEFEKNQRREAYRMPYVEKISYYRDENSTAMELLTRNISATGLRGVITERLSSEEVVLVELPMDGGNAFVYARIIDADKMPDSTMHYDVRLNFIESTADQREKIHRYILERQMEQLRKHVDRDGYSDLYKQMEAEVHVYPADFFSRATEVCIYMAYTLLVIVISILAIAQPKANTGIERLFNFVVPVVSPDWNALLLSYGLYADGAYLAVSVMALIFNALRVRKYGEKFKASVWFHLICALFIFVFCYAQLAQPVK